MSEQKCKFCGCTEERACIGPDGQACHWVADDWCSACAHQVEADLLALQQSASLRLELGGVECFALLSTIQLALRHPDYPFRDREIITAARDALQKYVSVTPHLRRLAEMGNDPQYDVVYDVREQSSIILPPGFERE
jgi:hypothetical protein